MRNIQDIVHEVMKRKSLDGKLRAELEGAAEYRPTLFEYLTGSYVCPVVQSTPEATVVGYHVMQQVLGWKGWRPAVKWYPAETHLHTHDRDGDMQGCMTILADKNGPVAATYLPRPQMPKIEGPVM